MEWSVDGGEDAAAERDNFARAKRGFLQAREALVAKRRKKNADGRSAPGGSEAASVHGAAEVGGGGAAAAAEAPAIAAIIAKAKANAEAAAAESRAKAAAAQPSG